MSTHETVPYDYICRVQVCCRFDANVLIKNVKNIILAEQYLPLLLITSDKTGLSRKTAEKETLPRHKPINGELKLFPPIPASIFQPNR